MMELENNRLHETYIKNFSPLQLTAFELVPQGSRIVADGEVLTEGPIRVELLPGATNCLSW